MSQAANFDDDLREQVPEKKSGSCCLYGCLGAFLLMVLLVVGIVVGGYFFVKGQVAKYTSDEPAVLPVIEMSEEEVAEVQARLDTFNENVEGGAELETLRLTADEVNALISQEEELKGRVHVTIEDGQVGGDVSIPTDFAPGGKGRFFNASAAFNVSLENGVLIVTLAEADVNGEPVPATIVEAIAKENLAKDAYKNPDVAKLMRRFESLKIEGNEIVLTPRAETVGESESENLPQEEPPAEESAVIDEAA